jgi:hypothetical protein
MGYGLDGRDQIPKGERDFFLFYSVQTVSGAHPVGTGIFFSRGKAAIA